MCVVIVIVGLVLNRKFGTDGLFVAYVRGFPEYHFSEPADQWNVLEHTPAPTSPTPPPTGTARRGTTLECGWRESPSLPDSQPVEYMVLSFYHSQESPKPHNLVGGITALTDWNYFNTKLVSERKGSNTNIQGQGSIREGVPRTTLNYPCCSCQTLPRLLVLRSHDLLSSWCVKLVK